ncbi:MAG: carboxylating nicotinate-nucleotide diphosphorylase [Isosphaeraceae bacterium]
MMHSRSVLSRRMGDGAFIFDKMNIFKIGTDARALAPLLESVRTNRLDYGPAERAFAGRLIDLALIEDLGTSGDSTAAATIPETSSARGRFVSRGRGVIAGMQLLDLLIARFESISQWNPVIADGETVEPGSCLATIAGSAHAVLALERTALNFLSRLSGIATLTAKFVDRVQGSKAVILDTRKTTPGWRVLEKQAVRCGSGRNHRMGLFDAVLIKENHLAGLGDEAEPIARAIDSARKLSPIGAVVEIEVDTFDQLDRALAAVPDIILVDNFGPKDLIEAVRRRDLASARILLEVSGGVTLETVAELARTGVDRISIGALTHSAPSLDIGLDRVG